MRNKLATLLIAFLPIGFAAAEEKPERVQVSLEMVGTFSVVGKIPGEVYGNCLFDFQSFDQATPFIMDHVHGEVDGGAVIKSTLLKPYVVENDTFHSVVIKCDNAVDFEVQEKDVNQEAGTVVTITTSMTFETDKRGNKKTQEFLAAAIKKRARRAILESWKLQKKVITQGWAKEDEKKVKEYVHLLKGELK